MSFRNKLMCRILAVLLPFSMVIYGQPIYAANYLDPPAILEELINNALDRTFTSLQKDPNDTAAYTEISSEWGLIVLYTVADALSVNVSDGSTIRDIQIEREKIETTRTDKQIGPTGKSVGTTSLVEKPGIPRLLALAIGHGAIEQDTVGTSITMSTSPYSILALFAGDTHENYNRYHSLPSRIGVSTSFALSDDDKNPSNQFKKDNLEQVAIRFRLFGDRSTRSEKFNNDWLNKVKPLLLKRGKLINGSVADFFEDENDFEDITDDIEDEILSYTKTYLSINHSIGIEAQKNELRENILDILKEKIYDPVAKDTISFPDKTVKHVTTTVIKNIQNAGDLMSQARAQTEELANTLQTYPLGTFSYTYQKLTGDSNISEFKFIVDAPVTGNSLFINAFISLNHDPKKAMAQQRIRDAGASLAWERKIDNVFSKRTSNSIRSPMTLALEAKLSTLDTKFDKKMFVGQLRFDIPIADRLSIPVSASYTSRTLENPNDDFRISFGMGFDIDKLLALAQQ